MSKKVKVSKGKVPKEKKSKGSLNSIDSYDLGTKEWEDSIMFPLKFMRVVLIVYVALALLLPMYKDTGLFIDSFVTFVVIIIQILGLASCWGRVGNFDSLQVVALIRVVQFLINFFFIKKGLNYLTYIPLVFVEMSLSVLYLLDKSKYECVIEREL